MGTPVPSQGALERPQQVPFRRSTWQEAVEEYLPVKHRGAIANRWIERLPIIAVLAVMSALSLRLRNTAFIDEALYINAGQDYISHWLHGTAVPNHGEYFSGAPGVYPVLAAALDSVGGLYLVRLFSLLCIGLTVICIEGIAATMFESRRVGFMAAMAFALTGPVIFISYFATFDAVCIALLAAALWLGVTKTSCSSAIAVGALLAVAVTVKYTGAIFVPVVLFLILIVSLRHWARVVLAMLVATGLLVTVYLVFEGSISTGLAFTTTERKALSPASTGFLVGLLALNIGPLGVLAVVGASKHRSTVRKVLISLCLLGSAALLPVAQLKLGEAVSFEKHTSYSALFLSLLAGYALSVMSRGMLKLGPVLVIMLTCTLLAVSRSAILFNGWVDVAAIVAAIDKNPAPGIYISSQTDSLKYYTRQDHPEVVWETTFALYADGDGAIEAAVADKRYRTVILRTESTGSTTQDAGQRVFEAALRGNPSYVLTKPFKVSKYSEDRWLVFNLAD